jgi:hypothetical protein
MTLEQTVDDFVEFTIKCIQNGMLKIEGSDLAVTGFGERLENMQKKSWETQKSS